MNSTEVIENFKKNELDQVRHILINALDGGEQYHEFNFNYHNVEIIMNEDTVKVTTILAEDEIASLSIE